LSRSQAPAGEPGLWVAGEPFRARPKVQIMKKGRVTIDPALFFLEVKELDITHLARHRSHIYIILLPLIASLELGFVESL
jgi:hypothetical protein